MFIVIHRCQKLNSTNDKLLHSVHGGWASLASIDKMRVGINCDGLNIDCSAAPHAVPSMTAAATQPAAPNLK